MLQYCGHVRCDSLMAAGRFRLRPMGSGELCNAFDVSVARLVTRFFRLISK